MVVIKKLLKCIVFRTCLPLLLLVVFAQPFVVSAATVKSVNSFAPPSNASALFDFLWNNTFHYMTLFDNLSGFHVTGNATVDGNQLILATGLQASSTAEVTKTPVWQGVVTFSQRSRFRTTVTINNLDHLIGYVGTGNHTGQGYGFKIADGNLYGYSNDGTTEKTVLLQTINNDVYNLEARYKPKSMVVFYVNKVLKGNVTTNLPSSAKVPNQQLLDIYLQTTDDHQKSLQTSYFEYLQMRNVN